MRAEAWPEAANADELHDALVWLGFLTAEEADAGPGWSDWLAELAREQTRDAAATARHAATLWIAAERLPQFQALWPRARLEPAITAPAAYAERRLVARRGAGRDPARPARGLGPVTRRALAGAARALTSERYRRRARGARGRRLRACAAASRRARQRRNGASAGCSRASTATRSSACGRRSSRSRRATSCASCSAGSASRPTRAWKGRTRSRPWSASSKASRRRPAPGRPRSCRRASPATSQPGSTICASPGGSPGRGCGRARASRTMASGSGGQTPVRTTPITLLARRHAALWASLSTPGRRVHPSPPGAGRSRSYSRSTAPRSSTSWWKAPACCARRSRRRWANWSRSAS